MWVFVWEFVLFCFLAPASVIGSPCAPKPRRWGFLSVPIHLLPTPVADSPYVLSGEGLSACSVKGQIVNNLHGPCGLCPAPAFSSAGANDSSHTDYIMKEHCCVPK